MTLPAGIPLDRPLTDSGGFVAFYDREARFLLLFCTRQLLDPEAALDITAETMAQAFRGRARFRGTTQEEARAWLLTIARRQIAGYLRRGALDRSARERLGIQTPTLSPEDLEDIEREASLPALRAALGVELDRLTADQRDALRLRVVEERPYPDVARALGVSEATARARVSRGLRALAGSPALRALHQGERA